MKQIKMWRGGDNTFIDEFYYGNIDAQETRLTQDVKFKKKMEQLSDTEKRLFESLKGEEYELFEDYSDAWSYVNSESNRDSFKNGFRLGVKCIIDVFAD